jgi:hypothetical protein
VWITLGELAEYVGRVQKSTVCMAIKVFHERCTADEKLSELLRQARTQLQFEI